MTAGRRALQRRRRRGAARGGGRRRLRRLLLALAGLAAALTAAAAAAAGAGAFVAKQQYDEFVAEVAPPGELLAELPRGGARVYDRHGALLYEFVDAYGGLRRPVPLDGISEWMVRATVATEDASFWENNGLNIRGLARAGVENFSPFGDSDFLEGSGGSSITQQLAKNVYIPRAERAARTVDRKLREAAIALELTQRYTKEQILEWYLNSISYGGIYVGIQAAAEGYFDKQASDLTLAEAALLAGIPQSPALYDPLRNRAVAVARQHEVLDLMARHGAISPAEADAARRQELRFKANRFRIEAPHFVLGRVAREIEQRFGERALYENGLEVITTLDLGLQREAERILERRVAEFEETSDNHNGALYALDVASGQVLAYVGSRDYFDDGIEGRNDNVVSLNSPGSALKPFTYMTAFMRGWSTGTGILDTPVRVIDPGTGQFYVPRNPGGGYRGPITAADALGNSLNISAFKAIAFAGVDNALEVMRQLGLTTLDSPLGYGPALTLGGADITLGDLTYAYGVLANGGVMPGQEALAPHDEGERELDPIALLRVTDGSGAVLHDHAAPAERRVVGADFAYLVTSILTDPETRCLTFSRCRELQLPEAINPRTGDFAPRPSAWKTGTSEPFANSRAIGETWALGYTPSLVAGVWIGNADNAPLRNLYSTTVAWPAWRDFMAFAHDRLELPAREFDRPPGVEQRELCWPSGRLPSEQCPDLRRYRGLFSSDALLALEPDGVRDIRWQISAGRYDLARLTRDSDPEALTDSWWREVAIDTRTGLLAGAETPAAFVAREVRLALPANEVARWGGLAGWAAEHDATQLLAPSEASAASAALVRVASPAAGQRIFGSVAITGRADSPGFRGYAVEWGRGADPGAWTRLLRSDAPPAGGVLATWDTTRLADGAYSLRVLLEDEERGLLHYRIPVTIANHGPPTARIGAPADGAVVAGVARIGGVAESIRLLEVRLEVGVGLRPLRWELIRSAAGPEAGGALGSWDTTAVADGVYTIRLTVRDRAGGETTDSVAVTVRNAPETANPPLAAGDGAG